jgi:hypothetical protein
MLSELVDTEQFTPQRFFAGCHGKPAHCVWWAGEIIFWNPTVAGVEVPAADRRRAEPHDAPG